MSETVLQPREAAPEPTVAPEAPRLDLTGMSEPENLEEVRLEELTIDGICGVY